MLYPAVIRVLAQHHYQLQLAFDNGEQAILDLRPYLDFGVFSRLEA